MCLKVMLRGIRNLSSICSSLLSSLQLVAVLEAGEPAWILMIAAIIMKESP